jgi:hypothetical protein
VRVRRIDQELKGAAGLVSRYDLPGHVASEAVLLQSEAKGGVTGWTELRPAERDTGMDGRGTIESAVAALGEVFFATELV